MERCNTCPHWALAEDYALLPVVDGMDRVCALTVSDFNTPAPGEAAFAASEGDATALYARPDFGCTEHPGNR